jgi:EpsI family protein
MGVAADSLDWIANRSIRTSAVAYAALLLGLLACWPSVRFLAEYWVDLRDYRHGYPIALASAIWLGALRSRIDEQPPQPELLALLPLLACILLWLIVYAGNSALGQQLLVPPMLLLSVFAATGRRVAAIVIAPVAYLYFAVPIWDYLIPLLQRMTVVSTETALAFIGIPAVISDYTVTIPEGTFQIAEECSGKRYLMVGLAVACIAAVAYRLPRRRAVALIGIAAVMSLVTNWLRIIIIIYAGHVSEMRSYLVSVEHATFGWALFAVLPFGIVFLAERLAGARRAPVHAALSAQARVPGRPVPLAVWVPFALLILCFLVATAVGERRARPVNLGALPVFAEQWQGPLPPDVAWQPSFVGYQHAIRAAYGSDQGSVEVYVNVYGEQAPGRELVYYGNEILSPGEWQSVSNRGIREALAVAFGKQPIRLQARARSGERWVVEYLYAVGGYITGNAFLAQLRYGATALTHGRPSGLVAFAARCREDCDEARRLLAKFRQERGQAVLAMIPEYYPADLSPGREVP